LARSINDGTPMHIVRFVESIVAGIDEPVITLLGLSYKGNIDDMRESPSHTIGTALEQKGYSLKRFDPYIRPGVLGNKGSAFEAVERSDCLVLLTDHSGFRDLDYEQIGRVMRTRLVLDTRNMLNAGQMAKLGFTCYRIGTPAIRSVLGYESHE
jgi:UDP-N-acetyl-D-mannosaminuronic acid dehydrogenase